MKTAICVATYRRPEWLARLLDGLNSLQLPADFSAVSLIVIDNDPDGSARTVCDRLAPSFKYPIRYQIESRQGIAHARNRALTCVDSTIDWIAFIDDDEVPEPTWLAELFRVQAANEADVVAGPVLPRFEGNVPAWIVKGEFFDRRRYPTGHPLQTAATNNVLFRAQIIRGLTTHFDKRLALTGGEDSQFFRRLHRAGFKIVWADSAIVHEWVPMSRANATWLIRRMFRIGNAMTAVEFDLTPGVKTVVMTIAKALVWLMFGMATTVWGLFAGRHHLVKGARFIAFGLGRLAWFTNVRYEEYRREHGGDGCKP